MERIESSETSAYINTLTPGTYTKEKKLQSKHSEGLKSRKNITVFAVTVIILRYTGSKGKFRAWRWRMLNGQLVRSLHIGLFVTYPVCRGFKGSLKVKRNIVSFPETERQLSNHLGNEQGNRI